MSRLLPVLAAAVAFVPLGSAAPASLPLAPCTLPGGVAAQCGTLTVLEDRAQPTGRTIALRVAVVPAWGDERKPDPIVHITGGPGGSALADAAGVRSLFFGANASRDIVLVDQRGTGGSNPLVCPPPAKGAEPRTASAVREFVRRCLAGIDADPRRYTTVPAMDDLAEVVRALGYGEVNLYGASYGATAAQYFLAQHPELVRTVILDGATLLDVPIFELWGRNGDRALRTILGRCATSRPCSAAFPRVRREVFEVLAGLKRRPVRAGGRVIDAPTAAEVFQHLSRSPAGAARIPSIAHRARLRDWTPLVRAAREQGGGAPAQIMYWSIVCNEPWARFDPVRSAAASRGTYLADERAADVRLYAAACSAMPKVEQPAWSYARVRSDKPVLLVVGGTDPQDPASNVAAAERELPNSRTLVVPAAGHGSAQLGCVPQLAQQFVERGTAAGLDTACVRRWPPPPFVLR